MPEISRFFGIIVAMFYSDHDPPHFHVRYGSHRARFRIDDLQMLDGDLGPKARGLVLEWAEIHRAELQREWELVRTRQPLFRIPPLE